MLTYRSAETLVLAVTLFRELRVPDGRAGACFVNDFDQGTTDQRVTITGVGRPPFG